MSTIFPPPPAARFSFRFAARKTIRRRSIHEWETTAVANTRAIELQSAYWSFKAFREFQDVCTIYTYRERTRQIRMFYPFGSNSLVYVVCVVEREDDRIIRHENVAVAHGAKLQA